jgi:hypothetical protein
MHASVCEKERKRNIVLCFRACSSVQICPHVQRAFISQSEDMLK